MLTRNKLTIAGAVLAAFGTTISTMPGLTHEWATWLDSVIRAAGVFLVYLASGKNPDGTPAAVSYQKEK